MFSVPNGYPFTPAVSTIPASGVNYLWSNFVNAWDIVGGGTYTPTAKTTLGGDKGLRCNFTAVGLEVQGVGGLHVLSGSTGYIDNGANFQVTLGGVSSIYGEERIENGGLLVVKAGGNLTAQNLAVATWASGSSLTMNSGSTLDVNGTCTLDGSTTRTGSMTLSGSGAYTFHRYLNKGSVGATTSVNIDYDIYKFDDPSAPSTCDVVRPATATSGIVLRVYSVGTITNSITFEDNMVGIARIVAGAGNRQTIDFVWRGTFWETMMATGGATAL